MSFNLPANLHNIKAQWASPLPVEEGMLLHLADGSICACNHEAEIILGYTASQIQGRNLSNFPWRTIYPDGLPFSAQTHPGMIALQTGQPYHHVVMGFYKPQGKLIRLLLNSTPLFQTESTTAYAVVTTFKEIAEDFPELNDHSAAKADNDGLSLLSCDNYFFNCSVDLLCVAELDGYFKRLNPAFTQILGYSAEELLGYSFIHLVHPDDRAATVAELETLKRGKATAYFKNRYRCQDGSYKWLEWTAIPIVEAKLMYAIAKDITHLKQIQEALREQQKRVEAELRRSQKITQIQLAEIETIYASAPIGLCFVDTNLRFVRINEYLAQINGRPVSEHIGRTIRDILPELADQLEPHYWQVIESGEPIMNQEVYGFTHSQPSVKRCCSISYYPLKQEDGQILGINVMVQEITERKQNENALRQSEERFRLAINHIPDIFVIYDAQGRIQYVNQAGIITSGKSLDDFIGRTDDEVFPPEITKAYLPVLKRTIETKTSQTQECTITLPSKQPYTIIVQYVPLLDSQGEIQQILGITYDITERKQAETALQELMQREQVARQEAEKANRIKDEFLAVLSHELRTPLNPILGWARLLKSGKLDTAKSAEAVDIIERNAKLQVELIDDLLDISRILRGKLTLNITNVNLKSAISAALQTVHLASQAKEIYIETVLPEEIAPVVGDAARIQQVLWNLLSNAIKFTPPSGRVEVRLEQVGSMAQITVSDTGKGINPDFLPYIFEHFRQEDSTTTRKFGGLGLGLAIVRHLVELHGGNIEANSLGVGLGASFTVKLPLITAHSANTDDEDKTDIPLDLSGIKVLVVDDEPDSLDFVSFVLELYNAEVQTASSPLVAIQILLASKLDVLVSDIGMPGMDGYEFLRQVRTWTPENGGQIPAIALTAYAGEFNRQQAITAGFQMHIPKPIESKTLAAAIAHLIRKEQGKGYREQS
ncbi:PAS domain-containing hybrid sensor histidine kinase/response regulator [Anabaena azotica]|uniref:histidine kinase n=1 Tax=Anabaena azotica FACHB-119 TaxID=947527 RepID=A0ABR8D259_9NOST|nr:PAS domain S-box protein [Anabaena azotica]MBD2501012.1 PAS domain S-box protein [Anabaena azotica FACHB-119]